MAAQAERGLTIRQDRTISDPREERRLLSNLILPDATEEERNLVLNICGRYNLDPLLKHVALIGNGNRKSLYITRDGLIRVAHQSGQFNGMQVVQSEQDSAGKWRVTVDVYRKDMGHAFRYTAMQEEHEQPKRGNYDGPWQKSPHAMTQKCAEVMALRRAFDVSLGAAEEVGYDGSQRSNIGEVTIIEAAPARSAPVAIAAPREKAAPPPLPAQGLAADEFAKFLDGFLVMAEEGYSNDALIGAMTAKAPELDLTQREDLKGHFGAIVAERKATRGQGVIEGAVREATPADTLGWTEAWSWFRANGFHARAALDAFLGKATSGMTPGEIKAAVEAQMPDAQEQADWQAAAQGESKTAPTTAAQMAASDDPFGDGAPASIAG